jgi:hypothetical protein
MLRFAPAPAIAGLNGKGGGMGVRRREVKEGEEQTSMLFFPFPTRLSSIHAEYR